MLLFFSHYHPLLDYDLIYAATMSQFGSKKQILKRTSNCFERSEPKMIKTFEDHTFPNLEEYTYKIVKESKVNERLTVVNVGVQRPASARVWCLAMGTPTCIIEKLYAKKDMGTTHDRFLLTPDYYNASNGSDFSAFLDHVEGVSEKIGQLLHEHGYPLDNWSSPVRKNDGVVEGLQVKVRQAMLGEKATASTGPVKAVVKLSCVYLLPGKTGLSFEMVDFYNPYACAQPATTDSATNTNMKESEVKS